MASMRPGLLCPGRFIEARSPSAGGSGRRPFRGIKAPASLKPHPVFACIMVLSLLPGHKSPGLIEAAAGQAQAARVAHLPGHKSPGLIEAMRPSSMPARAWRPSGA